MTQVITSTSVQRLVSFQIDAKECYRESNGRTFWSVRKKHGYRSGNTEEDDSLGEDFVIHKPISTENSKILEQKSDVDRDKRQ